MQIKNVTARVEDGYVIVDVELKEFNPKDGDFLISKKGKVFIYNGKKSTFQYGAYCGIDIIDIMRIYNDDGIDGWTSIEGCRYATEEEINKFLERLNNQHLLRWNTETKRLEKIRWRAKKDEDYFSIKFIGGVSVIRNTEFNDEVDNERYKEGNYFRTIEDASKVVEKIKEIFRNAE